MLITLFVLYILGLLLCILVGISTESSICDFFHVPFGRKIYTIVNLILYPIPILYIVILLICAKLYKLHNNRNSVRK
ncbi:MAG: hypothetical protein UV01_C0009G0006 [Parcubacteria group bacterium GW2011_GWA2_42_14]|nr:MAG: hypothetical protein UV01_C0009G0006 [Parcubacteria group bacterium GW2011_GWA2_42_14]